MSSALQLRPLSQEDLQAVAQVHIAAFRKSALSAR